MNSCWLVISGVLTGRTHHVVPRMSALRQADDDLEERIGLIGGSIEVS
jgi:hypothetical protein